MVYSVKYRKQGQWFWRKLSRVVRDEPTQMPYNPRVFTLESGERVEVPTAGTEFWFSPEHRTFLENEIKRVREAQTQAELEKLKAEKEKAPHATLAPVPQ